MNRSRSGYSKALHFWAITLFALLSADVALGAQDEAQTVEIVATANDGVGQRLVFALKERIRASSSLALTFDQSAPRMQVLLVTLDPAPPYAGSTAYSMVLVFRRPDQPFAYFLNQYVGTCPARELAACADRMAASITEQADFLKSLASNKT